MPEFSKLFLYSTQGSYYVVGKSKSSSRSDDRCWAILTLKRAAARSKDPDLSVHETPSLLTQAQCSATLRQLHAGNVAASPPGLQLVCKVRSVDLRELMQGVLESVSRALSHHDPVSICSA